MTLIIQLCRDIWTLLNVAERYSYNSAGISHGTKRLIETAGITAVEEGETRRLRNVLRLGFHAFRHSYVSMLINSGVNPLVVRDLVGHTTIDMTARYTHVALDTKINAVKSLPDFVPVEKIVQTGSAETKIRDGYILNTESQRRLNQQTNGNKSQGGKHGKHQKQHKNKTAQAVQIAGAGSKKGTVEGSAGTGSCKS